MLLDTPNSEQERTESATPKRREEARKEGRVPRSQELSGAVLLLAGACGLAYAAGLAATLTLLGVPLRRA